MSNFQWSKKAQIAAFSLADGDTQIEAADKAGVSKKTIYRWLNTPAFSEEVDRLVMMTGIAMRSERIKITKRVVRQRIMDTDLILSEKDILDWLKFAQSETDGIKLDLAALLDAASDPLATKRPGGSGSQAGNGEDA